MDRQDRRRRWTSRYATTQSESSSPSQANELATFSMSQAKRRRASKGERETEIARV